MLLIVAVAFYILDLTAQPKNAGRRTGLTPRRLLVTVLILAAIVVGAQLPAKLLTSTPPPPRAEIYPGYATVLTVAFLAWSLGVNRAARRSQKASGPYRRRLRFAVAATVVAAAARPALTIAEVAQSWQAMDVYAAAKDSKWTVASNAAPGSDVVFVPVPTGNIGPLSHDDEQETQSSAGY